GPCPVCGRTNPVDARFCGGCGHGLQAGGERVQEGVADPLVGRVIADRYRILELLGRGGMGVVYKVEHIHIGKWMAMKLLHGELARDRNTVKRFQREAEAASRLSHPNTVQVFDFGRSEGLMYLVMEYLEGRDLGQLIRDGGPLEFARAARLCAQVCASVAEAHAQGIVHRDLKPENVMILPAREGRGEIAKVLDFGLAKLRDQRGNITVTRAGSIVGTPYYMPPEQIRGEEVDPRGDVYALGAMLYKACTGVPPFVANTPMGVLTKHLTEKLVPPSQRSGAPLPLEADRIVGQAMQKERGDRYPNAEALRQDLLEYLRSVGEAVSDPSLASISTTQAQTPAGRGAAATRKDVDRYEKRLRRRGLLTNLVVLLLVGGLGYGGWLAWERYRAVPEVPTTESEPNDLSEQADPLPLEATVRGYLGKRQSREVGDVDLYRISNPSRARRELRVEVGALPNIDVMIDVVRADQTSPVLSADSGGVGVPERIPNFPVSEPEYLLRVRERWITGELPTENVSDEYTIRYELVEPEEGWESEVNDSLELADALPGGPVERRGYIGWAGDEDVYCFEEDGPPLEVALSGVDGLDLVLRAVDRVRARSTKANDGGVGEGERVVLEQVQRDRTCVTVSADEPPPDEERLRANPRVAYTLSVRPPSEGEGDGASEGGPSEEAP
ncbi:MAG TPA: serine/threonine-protein kinase, partial [Polyangiaceae bacterium LLY-WYZ-15_(1-7)]|nr:serine/threonine-protein kinase [Polyangiaceae bacterium LLY-WYZ-15_(1-7)]